MTTTTLTIPRLAADRLSRLHLACSDETGPLGHVGVRITPTAARFAATDGRILASLVIPLDAMTGESLDFVLDAEALTAACKAMAKQPGRLITVEIGPKEARLTNGTASTVVRRVDGSFPRIEHVWTRTAGRQWLPTISSLNPALVAIAQKISGNKSPLLFSSPADPAARLERLWTVPGAATGEGLDLDQARQAVNAPGYWADHELAVLIMPIARPADQCPLDLQAHAVAIPAAAAAA